MTGRALWGKLYPTLTSREWLLGEIRAGKSGRQIAREIGCCERTIYKALRAAGITFPYVVKTNDQLVDFERKVPK